MALVFLILEHDIIDPFGVEGDEYCDDDDYEDERFPDICWREAA